MINKSINEVLPGKNKSKFVIGRAEKYINQGDIKTQLVRI